MRFWLIPPLAFLSFGFTSQSFVWQLHQAGAHLTNIRRLAVHPQKSHVIYFVASGGLYKADLQSRQSSLLFTFPASDSEVHDLIVSLPGIYAATSGGVYAVNENGGGELIFQASEDQRPCLSLAQIRGMIFIGTSRGVKYRALGSGVWNVLNGPFHNQPVTCLRGGDPFLYISAGSGIVRYDSRSREFREILREPSGSFGGEVADSDIDAVSYAVEGRQAFLGFDTDGPSTILAMSDAGVSKSSDSGDHWQRLASGALSLEIHAVRILHLQNQPYVAAATNQGVYILSDGRWMPLRSGMETVKVRDVVQTSGGEIVAATDRGIFVLTQKEAPVRGSDDHPEDGAEPSRRISESAGEPSIRDVQEMAVEYAEVHPDKIEAWRRQARRRAILPDVSLGFDRDAADYLHWDTGSNPDELVTGRELINWDVSFSWDLGDLIWSTDQTSIDSRSKLMVELRDDILNQVTRIYFERRRLQAQMDRLEDDALKEETDLRIQELSALLDAFTGGRFSTGEPAGSSFKGQTCVSVPE